MDAQLRQWGIESLYYCGNQTFIAGANKELNQLTIAARWMTFHGETQFRR
jgi:hypothetical protein